MSNNILIVVVLSFVVVGVLMTDIFSNLWSLLTARGFIIPTESSIVEFKATILNQGSGEWWVYGEDAHFFYYFTGDEKTPYIKIERRAAVDCRGFDPFNHLTWCPKQHS